MTWPPLAVVVLVVVLDAALTSWLNWRTFRRQHPRRPSPRPFGVFGRLQFLDYNSRSRWEIE